MRIFLKIIFIINYTILFSAGTLPDDAYGAFKGSLSDEDYKVVISSLANGIDFTVINSDGKEINESSIYNVVSINPDPIIEFTFKSKINIKLTFITLLNKEQWEMNLGPKTIFLNTVIFLQQINVDFTCFYLLQLKQYIIIIR